MTVKAALKMKTSPKVDIPQKNTSKNVEDFSEVKITSKWRHILRIRFYRGRTSCFQLQLRLIWGCVLVSLRLWQQGFIVQLILTKFPSFRIKCGKKERKEKLRTNLVRIYQFFFLITILLTIRFWKWSNLNLLMEWTNFDLYIKRSSLKHLRYQSEEQTLSLV